MNTKILILGFLNLVILPSCGISGPSNSIANNTTNLKYINCNDEVRGGFDIGSASTKLQLARVKVCDNGKINIVKVYYKKNISVKYGEDLKKSSNQMLSGEIISSGVQVINKLQEEALNKLKDQCPDCTVSAWRAVSTEVFRNTSNWNDVNKALSERGFEKEKDILIKRLTQQEEALFGFYPITKLKNFNPKTSVVWDLGGASSQLTIFEDNFIPNNFSFKDTRMLLTQIGTSSFKDLIIKSKKGKNKTVNPVVKYNDHSGTSDEKLYNELKDKIKNIITNEYANSGFNDVRDFSGKNFYVIGGILSRLMPKVTKICISPYFKLNDINSITPYSHASLAKEGEKMYTKDDNELIRDYKKIATNDAFAIDISSNTLLAEAYMSGLNAKEVYPVSIDGTDTIMLHPNFSDESYWKKDSNIK